MVKPVMGVDVGATGVKAALVDPEKGVLLAPRIRCLTPQPATPEAISAVVTQLVDELKYKGPVGVGFPSVVRNGVCRSAVNIDPGWTGVKIDQLLQESLGMPVRVANDADCAGIAESRFGELRDVHGLAILLTIGTGIGSAVFYNGTLIPNVELGSMRLDSKKGLAERYVSNRARKEKGMSWEKWGKRFNTYLELVNEVFYPEKIVLGGGISKKFDEYKAYLTACDQIVPARLFNDSGIIGAAMLVDQKSNPIP